MQERVQAYDWPGNVRELKSVIERSTANAWLQDESLNTPLLHLEFDAFHSPYRLEQRPSSITEVETIDVSIEPASSQLESQSFSQRVMIFERRLIDEALAQSGHHQGKAANELGLSYHQFRGLLRKHGLKK